MTEDSIRIDTGSRPLPVWLTRQKEGLNTIQPEQLVMKEDRSLQTSFIATGILIFLVLGILTIVILRRKR